MEEYDAGNTNVLKIYIMNYISLLLTGMFPRFAAGSSMTMMKNRV
jgi:hypothetical protein